MLTRLTAAVITMYTEHQIVTLHNQNITVAHQWYLDLRWVNNPIPTVTTTESQPEFSMDKELYTATSPKETYAECTISTWRVLMSLKLGKFQSELKGDTTAHHSCLRWTKDNKLWRDREIGTLARCRNSCCRKHYSRSSKNQPDDHVIQQLLFAYLSKRNGA